MCVCVYIYTYIHTYIHIYRHTVTGSIHEQAAATSRPAIQEGGDGGADVSRVRADPRHLCASRSNSSLSLSLDLRQPSSRSP